MRRWIPTMLAAAMLAVGCQTWGPTWSELTGEPIELAGLETDHFQIDVLRVDEESVGMGMQGGRSVAFKVAPGRHLVEVGAGRNRRSLTVDAAPCKRYYLSAQRKDRDSDEWTPVVDRVEAIAGCKVP